jgi:hypothetical protein
MAKKTKGFGELLKQERISQSRETALEKLQEKVRQGPLGKNFASMVSNPKGEVKMSEVLEAFVDPYLDSAKNRTQRERLFGIASLAWNLAIMSESDRQPVINQMLKSIDLTIRQDTKTLIDELIARKQKFFADNERHIVDFQLQDMGDQFHLSVASTLLKPPGADA